MCLLYRYRNIHRLISSLKKKKKQPNICNGIDRK